MPETVYLSLGSNLGIREENLRAALSRLGSAGEVTAVSSFYETEPVEFTAQPWFLNCATALRTDASPQKLLAEILTIEREMGRHRIKETGQRIKGQRIKGPRIIDLDILFFGSVVIQPSGEAGLTVPHPALHERRFVLEPLAEIAPDFLHPVLKLTVRELLNRLPLGAVVRRQ